MRTPAQERLIERIAGVLSADARVGGAWLSGSLARDAGDRFSDVDVLVVSAGVDPAELAGQYEAGSPAICETVLAKRHLGRVLVCVTPEWDRFDLFFVSEAELAHHDASRLSLLFARTAARPGAPPTVPRAPSRLSEIVPEFLRVLGLLPVGLGRGELVLGLDGAGLLRRMLIDTMLERNGITQAERGGALTLNRFLTPVQRASLEALPPLAAERESLIAVHLALARLFLPLARELAAQQGVAWPQALEDAARRRLEVELGVGW